jgi:hypothetical protein
LHSRRKFIRAQPSGKITFGRIRLGEGLVDPGQQAQVALAIRWGKGIRRFEIDHYLNETLTTLASRLEKLPNRPKIILGCYFFQFLGPANYRGPISGAAFLGAYTKMLSFARSNIVKGRLNGIIFLASSVVNDSAANPARNALDTVKNWIATYKDDAIDLLR